MSIWLSEISSGVPALDQLHDEVFQALNSITICEEKAFTAEYRAFVAKLECAFRQEEEWMDELDFPSIKSHQEEHARVLGALHRVHSVVMEGNIQLGREFVERLLPQWLAFHISTADATLAVALQLVPEENALPLRCGASVTIFSTPL